MTRKPPEKHHGLTFYPTSHRYRLDGQWVPGVTTILGCLDKPAIGRWAATTVAEYVTDHPDAVETLRSLGRGPMVQALKELPWQKRDTAGERGNVLHDYAEQLLLGADVDVDDEHVPVMEAALAFMDEWHIDPLLIEAAVASRKARWAGTLDLVAKYKHPATAVEGVGIFDWKSGKGIYPEFAWQFSAYAHAEFWVDADGGEHPMPVCDAAYGVQIRADGFDVYPMAFGPDIYDEFLAIRWVFDAVKRSRGGGWQQPGSGYVGLAIQSHHTDTDGAPQ